jgi:hypothetical protein
MPALDYVLVEVSNDEGQLVTRKLAVMPNEGQCIEEIEIRRRCTGEAIGRVINALIERAVRP